MIFLKLASIRMLGPLSGLGFRDHIEPVVHEKLAHGCEVQLSLVWCQLNPPVFRSSQHIVNVIGGKGLLDRRQMRASDLLRVCPFLCQRFFVRSGQLNELTVGKGNGQACFTLPDLPWGSPPTPRCPSEELVAVLQELVAVAPQYFHPIPRDAISTKITGRNCIN